MTNQVFLDFATPIFGSDAQVEAILILRVDPQVYLFPLIQSWPTPSETAETLIVQKDGEDALYLNSLRFSDAPPLTLRIPISSSDVPAIQGILGKTGEFEGQDYRGVAVLAEIVPIPETPWIMIAKVDSAEILAGVRALGWSVLGFILFSVLMTALLALYTFNRRQKDLLEALLVMNQEKLAAQEEIRTTLYSIGDGVITTDKHGWITRLNPVAET